MSRRKEYYEYKRERVAKALQSDPTLTNEILRERFGVTKGFVDKVREEIGIPIPEAEGLHRIRKECKTPEKFSYSPYRSGK